MMSIPDIVLVILLCAGAIWGFMNGFLRGLVVVLGFAGGLFIANTRAMELGAFLRKTLGGPLPFLMPARVSEIIVYVIIVAVVMMVAYFIASYLHKVGILPFLGFLDFVGGLAAGAIEAGLTIEIALLVIAVFSPSLLREITSVSAVATRMISFAPSIFSGLPADFLSSLAVAASAI